MQPVQTILYVSTARQEPSLVQIDNFIARWRQENFRRGVTGVLIYSGGQYMGYLEGSQVPTTRLFDRIRTDPRHDRVTEILRDVRSGRLFSEWSMAFRTENGVALSDPSQRSWFPSIELVESEGPNGAPHILKTFWATGAVPGPAGR